MDKKDKGLQETLNKVKASLESIIEHANLYRDYPCVTNYESAVYNVKKTSMLALAELIEFMEKDGEK